MIVTKESPENSLDNVPAKDNTPPPYAPFDPSPSSSAPPFAPPADLKPSNYILLDQDHRSIQGSYLLDPSLEIPNEFLAPLPDGLSEDRRSNFHASSKHENVSAILYLLNKPMHKSRNKVILNTSSPHGTVSTCIRREGLLPAFDLKSESRNEDVIVKIPRTYRGMIAGTTKNGRIWMSDAVSARAVVLSDVEGSTKRIFIGDLSARNDETDDSMVLETKNGSVKVYFEDEDLTPAVVKGAKGLLKKFRR
ncbi:hypothetical protein GYMLUDRAFT_97115 [Collybiopsis luxurians FD-317 M1]|uniref:DUF7330 domain-containing protein n=1 Tax=Collybiopsis luxurians FD-317 M1 TaxID=944289 RepID=A0A0D0CW99_9AGAR|nr:hypothetical protein GYMLUDRAFT_97115 [Collybiopsis luxurians FD-317 M1]